MLFWNNTPLLMVVAFLILTLVVGFYFSRKTTTLREYAVGNKQFATATLVATMLATEFGGGGLIRSVEQMHHLGLYWVCKSFISNISIFVLIPTALRMGPFMQHLSMPESIGSIYGIWPRIITALANIGASIASVAIQINVMSRAITMCVGSVNPQIVTIMATCILIVYSALGGIRAVTFTDVLQFITFSIIIPLLAVFMFWAIDKPVTAIIPFLQTQEKFQFNSVFHLDAKLIAIIALTFSSLIADINPTILQRVYMSTGPLQAKNIFLYTAIFGFFIKSCILLVGLFVFVAAPTLSLKEVWHYIIFNISPTLKGFVAISLLAMTMSTADSRLNTSSVMMIHDVLGSIKAIKLPFVHPCWLVRLVANIMNVFVTFLVKITSMYPILLARLISVAIGVSAMLLSVYRKNLLELLQLTFAFSLPITTAPFLLAIYGFRGTARTALIGMFTGILAIIAWNRWIESTTGINGAFPCMLINGLAMLAAHYLLSQSPGTGWVSSKDFSAWDWSNKATKWGWKERFQTFTLLFSKKYQEGLFPKNGSTFILSGFYIIGSSLVALCFMQKNYLLYDIWLYGYMACMAIGASFAIYPVLFSYWKRGGNSLLHWVWFGLLFVALFVAPIQWAKLGHFHPMVCALLVCNFLSSIVLLSLEVSMIMFGIAMIIHATIPPYLPFWSLYRASHQALSIELIFAIALGTAAVIGFGIYKRLRDKAAVKFKVMEQTRNYERSIALERLYNQAHLARLDHAYASTLCQEMDEKFNQFSQVLLQRIQAEGRLDLDQKAVKTIDIAIILAKVDQTIRGLGEPIDLQLCSQTTVTQLLADPALFEYFLMINLWGGSRNTQAVDHRVTLTIAGTALQYEDNQTIAFSQPTLMLPALAFSIHTDAQAPHLLPVYEVRDNPEPVDLPKSAKQFYQVESKQIVEAHGGYTEIIETQEALTCLYVLPIAGKQVMRFRTYKPADLVMGKVAETAESVAQEKELVTLLTKETALTKERAIQTIAFIKNAHGLVKRKSGAPYYTHPMSVAKLLLEVTKDPSTLLAGLLHDVVEDTPVTLQQIELVYGLEVAVLVEKVTHYHTQGYPWKLDDQVNKSILDQCTDIRVIQVKLADRLHNIQTLYARKLADQQRIAKETMLFYILLGQRHNISLKWLAEMQSICEKVLKQKNV